MKITSRPDLSQLDVPMNVWTEPFWKATAEGKMRFPRCGRCSRFRWPPGPFCPACHSQTVEWVPGGEARIYSFTIVPAGDNKDLVIAPALIAFADAPGIRLPAAIVETPIEAIHIGAVVAVEMSPALNALLPVFKIGVEK